MIDPEYIGLEDRDGTRIYVGDTVEFHFDADLGWSDVAHPDYTPMTDKVVKEDGKYFFLDPDGFGMSYAWRHNKHCLVVAR